MKTYKLPVKLVFVGTVKVRTNNKQEAKEEIKRNFSGILQSSGDYYNSDCIVDWDIDTHSQKTIV